MDDTDRKILILITANPRIHFQELAKRLGISKQAAHRRVQVLMETRVIQSPTAGISYPYLNAVPVSVFGRSNTISVEETLDRLGESEFTHRAIVAGGNYLYVVGQLRNVSDLDGYAEFVKRVAMIPEPTVAISCLDDGLTPDYFVDGVMKRKPNYKKLSPLDLRIIASLKDDGRRPIADIAENVGASAKTVRRHLEDMTSDGSLELHVPMDLPSGGPILLAMHVNLRDGADKGEVGRRLLSKYSFQDAYVRTFINIPGFLILAFWSDKVPEIRRVLRIVGEDEDVLHVMLNFCYLERLYPTWRDKLPEVQTRSSKKASTRNPPSRLRGL
jgi:DNA-binding Lrp family transcriptional regulator